MGWPSVLIAGQGRVVAYQLSIVNRNYSPRVFVFSSGKALMGRELLLLAAMVVVVFPRRAWWPETLRLTSWCEGSQRTVMRFPS